MLSRFKRNVVQYSSKKSSVKTKGLSNKPGQNNCFLNSAVQVLWHIDVFRTNFNRFTGHTCSGESCIFCALKNLFARFKYSQDDILPPTRLRAAMAENFEEQNRFVLAIIWRQINLLIAAVYELLSLWGICGSYIPLAWSKSLVVMGERTDTHLQFLYEKVVGIQQYILHSGFNSA